MTITGLLTLSQNLLCRNEVLGKEFKTCIAGFDINVFFPRYNYDKVTDGPERAFEYVGLDNPLLPPEIARDWHRGDEGLCWGCPCSYPDKDADVLLLAVSAECKDDEVSETAQTLYDKFGKWETSFIRYCILSSKQMVSLKEKNLQSHGALELMGEKGCINGAFSATLYGRYPSHQSCLTTSQIQNALDFAASGKELYLAYQMLFAAYEARDSKQNRQAIMDACSALELCFISKISDYCKEHTISSDILLEKYRSLGERLKLIEKIDSSFRIDKMYEAVIRLRNDIAHNKKVFPGDEETRLLIQKVESFLQLYYKDYYEKKLIKGAICLGNFSLLYKPSPSRRYAPRHLSQRERQVGDERFLR